MIAIDARLVDTDATGDATYWTSLIHELSNTSCAEKVILFTDKANLGVFEDKFDCHWLEAKSSRVWSYFAFPMTARRLGARVFHTQYSMSPLIQRGGVTTVHDVSFLIGPRWFKAKDRLMLSQSVPAAMRRADAVITVSETSKSEIEFFLPDVAGKVHAIYNGPNEKIRRILKERAHEIVRERLGEVGAYALTVGSKWPRKNLSLAIEAMEQVSLDMKLVLVGKSMHGDLPASTKVVHTGYVDTETLSALYCAASVYLAPSWHEGFGIPLLEAWECGCPVVCSVGGALPEVAGDAAEVVESWDPGDWAQVIQKLLRDSSKLDELRQNGYRRLERFSWKLAAEQTCAIYESLL